MSSSPAARILALVCFAAIAPAEAVAGDVSGTVVLAKKKQKPPFRSRGFVAPKPNPIMETRRFDPRPEIVIVLEGGPVPDEAKQPDRTGVKWNLLGESFDVPLLPVVLGTEIDLKNTGHGSPALYSPQSDKLVKSEPISPNGVRTLTVPEVGKTFEVRARGSAHLVGRVVAFPHRYFARLDSEGKWEIDDVPEGTWKVRVYYKNGYLSDLDNEIEVSRRDKRVGEIVLPASIDPAGASGGDDGSEGK